METITTEIIKLDLTKIRADIKKLSAEQRFLKDQRKTKKNKEARTMSPSEAAWQHTINREKLSIMYVVYGMLRGKDKDEQIKAHISKKENNIVYNLISKIDDIRSKYYIERK